MKYIQLIDQARAHGVATEKKMMEAMEQLSCDLASLEETNPELYWCILRHQHVVFLKPLCDCESRREAFFVLSNKIETPTFALRRNKNDKTEKIWQRFNLLQISFSPLKEVT